MSRLILNEQSSTPTHPASTKVAVFVDNTATPLLKMVDDANTVSTVLTDVDTVRVTNKDLDDSTTTISDVSASSKAIGFNFSGMTAAVKTTIANAATTSQTINLPVTRQAETLAVKPAAVATTLSTPLAPTGTTNTTGLMMGLSNLNSGLILTPQTTGRVMVTISGCMAASTTAIGATYSIRMGTGTAPTNGAALTGTVYGSVGNWTSLTGQLKEVFTLTALVTGLAVGTAAWIDFGLAATGTGTVTASSVSVAAFEL